MSLDQRLARIEQQLNDIIGTQAQQHETLVYHIKRTDAAEANLALLRKDFEPLKRHVWLVGALVKVAGLIAAGLAAAETLLHLSAHFRF